MSDRRIIALLNGFIGGILARISGPGAFRIISTVTADRDLTLPDANCTLTAGTSIAGSIANTQVAVGNGTNTVAGSANLTWASNVLTVGAASGSDGVIALTSAAATVSDKSQFAFATGSNRFVFSLAGAEAGADAGSNFQLKARTDAGALIDVPVSITRAAGGLITLARPTSVTSTTDSTTTATGSIITAGGLGVAKAITAGGIFKTTLATAATPAFTTYSAGVRYVFYDSISGSNAGFCVGVESGALWTCCGTTSDSFKWYGGTTLAATLTGGGTLTCVNKIVSTAPTGGIGYATGAGGTVTQITSRATGVTLSKVSGQITLFTAAGSATPATFVVTNTAVAATDTITINDASGATNIYFWKATPAAGSFTVTFWTTGGTASDTPVINFTVMKGVTS